LWKIFDNIASIGFNNKSAVQFSGASQEWMATIWSARRILIYSIGMLSEEKNAAVDICDLDRTSGPAEAVLSSLDPKDDPEN
jgi:hypothetical protein